mgnify:CR=1 FL=1
MGISSNKKSNGPVSVGSVMVFKGKETSVELIFKTPGRLIDLGMCNCHLCGSLCSVDDLKCKACNNPFEVHRK